MTMKELGTFLCENGVYDSFQFILSANDSINNACYCKDIILGVSKSIIDEHEEWRNNWSLEAVDGKECFKVNTGKLPLFLSHIFNVEISKFKFRDLLINSFFQNCRNALDALAQAANAGCLAFKAKRIETVDFPKMKHTFQQLTYSQVFPIMYDWFLKVDSSNDYKYIDMYCNRSKHTCSIETEYSYSLFGDESSSAIVPFFRKDTTTSTQYDKKEISDFIPKTYDFITAAYEGFLDAIKKEVIKKQYVINRFFSLSVFQQKIKGSPESSFSMPYMYADIDMNAMPEKIQVLLIKEWKENGRIVAKNSPFDTIYVKDKKVKDNPYTYIGKYVADDSIGEDSLLRFRQYTKVTPQEGEPPLIIQAMTDNKQKGMFYHKNPFFEIDTVSDDDDFIKRTSLPF